MNSNDNLERYSEKSPHVSAFDQKSTTKNDSVSFYLVDQKDRNYPFVFAVLCTVPARISHKSLTVYLGYGLKNNLIPKDQEYKILDILQKIEQSDNSLSKFVHSGEILHPIGLTVDEAYCFLKEYDVYLDLGVKCHIPKWWKNSNKVAITLNIGTVDSVLSKESILSTDPALYIGEEKINEAELKHLIKMSKGLIFFKGKWVEADSNKIKRILKLLESLRQQDHSTLIIEILRSKYDPDSKILSLNETSTNQLATSLIQSIEIAKNTDTFQIYSKNYVLRPYQLQGVSWLHHLGDLRLGSLLADDMGLGKTIQILALIEHSKFNKCLIVAPATLLDNWVSETKKFTPDISISILRDKKQTYITDRITLTNYEMVPKLEFLKTIQWDCLVIDEAQAIKNPLSARSIAIKQLNAKYRIALTGTPIENKLLDLWSIYDFILPGLLGTKSEFGKMVDSLKKQDDFSQLQNIIAPFYLRRSKNDQKIINELPEKIEIPILIELTPLQVELYTKEIQRFENALATDKKPFILPLLTKFKELCNHPDQYLGQQDYSPEISGKMQTLLTICENIYESREKVLVFTQYRSLIAPLCKCLATVFNSKSLHIDGDTPLHDRTNNVALFNRPDYEYPFMVLSLKAAGIGLNLTAASHVIHFDRWWNPAVENQATDRAYRIGQKNKVVVYKFICKNTIEEKIDQMIKLKTNLSNEIILNNNENLEKVLQTMSPEELLSLVHLDNY